MKVIVFCLIAFYCGAFGAPNDIDGRLIGGEEARRGEFPYMASINFCIGDSCVHICGGAIIDPEWVITAAHCVTDAASTGVIKVFAGAHELATDNPDRQIRQVLRYYIHPDFPGEDGPHAYDIILLKLEEPLLFNRLVHEVELPIHEFEYENDVLITGWGSIGLGPDGHIMPKSLHYVRTQVITEEDCKRELDEILGAQPHPLDHFANICTSSSNGRYVICSGDSGNPVVDYSGRRLLGIASWTITPCGVIYGPSVHNRISFFTPWIIDVISESEPEPGLESEPESEPEPELQSKIVPH